MELEPSINAWIERARPGRRVTGARKLTGGYSNDNTVVTMSDGERYVLRRYLRTNRCALERTLAERVDGVVPVAAVVAADPTGDSAGEPVLLSVFRPGRPVSELLTELDDSALAALGHDVGSTLACIGTVEFIRPGFLTVVAPTAAGAPDPDPGVESGARLRSDGIEPIDGLDQFVDRCLREGNADGHLSGDEQRALLRWAERAAPELATLKGSRCLVHSDYNPKNLLASGDRVTAVLDWEFAFSSSPLVDVGNMLRFPHPPAFDEAFIAGFRDAGGSLPPNWRRLSQALDLFALADFLTRPVEHRYFGRAIERIRALLAASDR
ncbi:phosphotransferase [Actinoplanes bogorensis]|uniref:Phosphotransferase n=1 Tax=Paractinoplanes bogorensis TaxID=1610840 RepID=A0ABS5YSR9_9ACTN|nr:phosphotransferase [Actinoplanes bogorensis]MBU2665085.1 phosphotransferase [Actinoplanes bogorensis]